ncbi:MAG: hypothetical protein F6K39_25805 [Okeania sp. SIO3B3]|nr:hypothetical protein [Okeania sp. SIO3B3]
MVEVRQRELEAGGRRFSQECHLNFIHAPMLPDMISEVGREERSNNKRKKRRKFFWSRSAERNSIVV